jgi:hypothetical protein
VHEEGLKSGESWYGWTFNMRFFWVVMGRWGALSFSFVTFVHYQLEHSPCSPFFYNYPLSRFNIQVRAHSLCC